MRRRATIAAILGLAVTSSAVCAADTLQWPRLGRPTVTVPGGLLEVATDTQGALSLERAGQVTALDTQWSEGSGAMQRGRAILPEDLSPGRYTVQLAGANGTTTRPGAVHILEALQEEYALAVIRGLDSPADGSPVLPADLGAQLSAAAVQMAIVLGPLTRGVTEEEFRALEALLLAVEVPVYLCPDRSDARDPAFLAHFGGPIHGATFGRDGYLFLGAGLFAQDPQTPARLGEAHLLRRAMRSSRWSVGIAGEYGLDWDLRSQIALFVDDPLNYLIAGSVAPALGATVPWGKTALALPADAPRGALAVLDVTATGIKPRPQPVAVGPPAATQEEAPVE